MSRKTIWKNYWHFALRIGLSMKDFWDMTPREFNSLIIDKSSEGIKKSDLSDLIDLLDKYNV